jgi:hypothetical protein
MNMIIERAHVWVASLDDQPGGLAEVLQPLKGAGADLDFIIARRTAEQPGKGVVFVTPLRSDREIAAAADLGFNLANSIHSVRVQGQNRAGLAADLVQTLATAGLGVRGLSAAELGTRFVMYIGFDSEADADQALRVLQHQWGSFTPELEESAA